MWRILTAFYPPHLHYLFFFFHFNPYFDKISKPYLIRTALMQICKLDSLASNTENVVLSTKGITCYYELGVGFWLYPDTSSVNLFTKFKTVCANTGLYLAYKNSTIITIATTTTTRNTVFTIGSISAIRLSYVYILINNYVKVKHIHYRILF
jgi:hypothetical protein